MPAAFRGIFEGVGSGADADRVLDAQHTGEHLLEFADHLAERKVARRRQGADVGEDRLGIGELIGERRVADSHGV